LKTTIFGSVLVLGMSVPVCAQVPDRQIDSAVAALQDQVIAWRRDIHQHPELSNRESRTAALVAEHLTKLGFEVRTGIAHTGVVGILRGGKPGPVIALRADMDALPVTELNDLPFKSTVTAEYEGQQTGVMHACGHDTHVAMLMGIAQVFADFRDDLPGTVMLVFQPAEEGAPTGEEGGAELMLEEGLFAQLRPEAMFAMHVTSWTPSGTVEYRSGPTMAAADQFAIKVKGAQTHGSRPWAGVDPIVVSSQIVLGLQTIISRQTDLARLPAVLTVGTIHGGVRFNIIPAEVEMVGTLRTFEVSMREDIIKRIKLTASNIAAASGATAEVEMRPPYYPTTTNNPELTARALPSLQRALGAAQVREGALTTASEDFAFFANEVPGFYFNVGATAAGQNPATAAANHSPLFMVDEKAMAVGMKAMLYVTMDYMKNEQ
jgi:amidohydrolase